uniref:NADH:ubiquinone reductase (H(+)-translocating) n=1 Tax=Taenia pisiformis TaxID=85432 RepID=D3YLT5_TAEPI|nr:NADH dehydrogenase subunit 5 [Taenia pisiformis]ADC52495.1 NADH dehydrogenase subunit 5 [Taenia pisiformis]QQY84934.1 NADH dehydrogenase subunit 5 [Taenia pisiformis]
MNKFLFSFIMCIIIWFVLLIGANFSFCINFLSFSGYNWLMKLDFDFISIGVNLMLVICFLYAYYYTRHYFTYEYDGECLLKIIILFVAVMALLVCTGDFLSTLVFWEYLGVVSFFLILFYANYLSLRSSIITLVSSRFGDVCIFILIGLNCFVYSNWVLCMLLFFFILFTKSASFPFISWLLEAMRAPTPVSSLVHSSTLVAAGIWFSMRYDYVLFFGDCLWFCVLLVLTIIITGISSFFFLDLKKIIALSTCNNISWCLLYLLYGDVLLSLFQLLSHGVSKCILFMLIGDVMSGSSGSQASNCVYSPVFYGNWSIFSSWLVIIGLAGVPFIGVFFTKHFLLSNFINILNISTCCIVMLCVLISYLYSFRLCSILLNSKCSCSHGVLFFFNSGLMVFFWLFINFYLFFNLDEVVYSRVLINSNLIFFQLLSILIATLFYSNNFLSSWSSSLFGCDNLVELCYSSFYNLMSYLNMFLFRWDNLMINLFTGIGYQSTVEYFQWVLLNLSIISIFGFFGYLIFF